LKEKIMEDNDVKRKNGEQGGSNAGSSTNVQQVRDDVKAAGTGSGEAYGTGIPKAGDHEMGVGGASGETDKGSGSARSGKTQDTRANFGVGGQDLNRDGLPRR
jgi:hypothetical protein